MRLVAMLMAVGVGSCSPPPTLLLLNFPEPDVRVVRVMQKVTVSDDRADEVLSVRGEGEQERTYRLFPDLATAMRLYLAAILVRDYPLAAERLPDSSLRLWVSMQYMTGVRLPDGRVRLTYGLSAAASGTGAAHLSYGWSTEIAVDPALEAEALAAEIEASLKTRAEAVVGDFVRAAAPFLTPPPEFPDRPRLES